MLHYIDSTLREGCQSGLMLFEQEPDMATYIEASLSTGLPDRFEIFRPRNPHGYIPPEVFWQLAGTHGEAMQVYCGPAHTFVPESIEGLEDTECKWLSFTLVHADDLALAGLSAHIKNLQSFSIRVGIECVAHKEMRDVVAIARRLAEVPGVKQINLNDSNGMLDPRMLQELCESLPQLDNISYGFHFHDDRRNGFANLEMLHKLSKQNLYYCDATFNGIGERSGIVSLQQVASLEPQYSARVDGIGQYFTTEALNFGKGNAIRPTVHAESHYDAKGRLRQEYRFVE